MKSGNSNHKESRLRLEKIRFKKTGLMAKGREKIFNKLFLFLITTLSCPGLILGYDYQPKVTNSFFETDIREALRDISEQTGARIIADESVQGNISIELRDVPLEDSLYMILSVGGYTFRKMPEDYYLVGLCTPNNPSFNRLSQTEFYRPKYLKAKEISTLISEFYKPYLQVNEESDIVTITACQDVLGRLKEDCEKIDQPKKDPAEPIGEDQFSRPDGEETLITRTFRKTDIKEALRELSFQSGVKVVADSTVQGEVSVALKEVPFEEALRMVLSAGGYTFRRVSDGYYLAGLCVPSNPSFNQLSQTDYFKPNYLKAKDFSTLISDYYQPYVKINEDSNTITITASPEMVKRLKSDLSKFDQMPRQVMIEALVIELSDEGKKSLGVTWGSMLDGGFSVYPPSSNFEYARSTAGKSSWEMSGSLSSDLFVRVNTLVSQGQAKIRANPRLATLEGKEAEINIGREEYYLISVGSGSQVSYTLQSIATGVVLKITPYVDKNNQIRVNFSPEVSEVVGKGATNLPVITKRTVTTSVRVEDGQTIAIGGLVQEQSSETLSKVPVMGSLPLVGALFRHKKTTSENKEVVIFITPRILREAIKPKPPIEPSAAKDDVSGAGIDRAISVKDKEEDKPLKIYYDKISRIIDNRKRFPDLEELKRGGARDVTLKFTVFSGGLIDKVEVLKSSGVPLLDLLASRMIEDISSFPAFSGEMKQSYITFVVPIKYQP